MKPKTEYRVACAHHGKKGEAAHSSHTWAKRDKAKAKQSVTDLSHHAETHPTSYYSREVPYRIQTREVTTWKDESDATE